MTSLLRAPLPAAEVVSPLLDRRHRPLRDIRISLTDHCNLRCTYCMPTHAFGATRSFLPTDKLLGFEDIAGLVGMLAELGVRKVKLTGGEPLVRPSVPELVARLKQIAPGIEVNLITNGVLLAPLAVQLRDAGLDRVTVSLDSLDPRRFSRISGRRDDLDRVLAGIDAAKRAGFAPVKINMVVIRGINDDETVAMARFFRSPATTVRFIEYMDVGTVNAWHRSQVVPAAEILEQLRSIGELVPVDPAYPGETARRYRWKDGAGEVGFIASVTAPFCGACSRLRLSADGKLFTCLFAKDGLDIRKALQPGRAAELRETIVGLWRRREDQYSVERAAASRRDKIEMFYIGG